MHFRSKSLFDKLNQYKQIIIYGIGSYAKEIYPQLKYRGLKQKISCFMQTKECEIDYIDGIPVISLDKFDYKKSEVVVLIAVSDMYLSEIKTILSKRGIADIVSLPEYLFDYKKTENMMENLNSFEEYCDLIADWYVENHTDITDKEPVKNKLLDRGRNINKINKDEKLIIFLSGYISARNNKIIGALKRSGYKIIVINYNFGVNIWCLNELKKMNIQIEECECIEEMLYKALQYNPLVYYFIPYWGDCLWAEIMFKMKKYFGKVILELYDVLNDGFAEIPQNRLDTERYALERADGIVWRWFSKNYLEKKGFQFEGKSLQFLDYCDYCNLPDIQYEERADSKVVKLCQVIGMGYEYIEKPYKTSYLDFATVGDILEKIGNRPDCTFHFYAGNLKEENIKRCMKYEQQYKNFKFFVNVEHSELIKRLREYDFGCDFYTGGEWPADDVVVGRYFGSSRINSARNVLFDYLSAGLPIITTTPLRLLEYLQKYDVVVKMNTANIDIDYLRKNKSYFKDRVKKAMDELNIDSHIGKLAEFMENL